MASVSSPARSRRRKSSVGFGLLGFSLALFLVSAIAALTVPAVQRALRESRAQAVAHDLRAFATAFQAYAQTKGDWPAGRAEAGAFPAGLSDALAKTNWPHVTPIGGHYTWAPDSLHHGERFRAAIVIASTPESAVSSDRLLLLAIDRALDDGKLDSGNFRLGYRNLPVFVIEH